MHPILQKLLQGIHLSGDLKSDVCTFLTTNGCPHTAAHSIEVGEEARTTAVRFGGDPQAAEKAGWLHDISAVFPADTRVEAARLMHVQVLPEEEQFPMIIHQKLSRVMAEDIFGIRDPAILDAVGCHTTLRAGSSQLDRILFVADKIAWDQPGIPPYLTELQAGLEHSLDHAAFAYLSYLWERRDTLRVIHPWLRDAYAELEQILRRPTRPVCSAIVLDLDGTLLNSRKEVSLRNAKAVLDCHRQGIHIIFATARPPRTVNKILPEELLSIGSFIYYNGAQYACTGTGLEWHESIDAALTAQVLDFCIARDPQIEISMEVRDEWFSARPLDYSEGLRTDHNPVVKTLEQLRELSATKVLLTRCGFFEELRTAFAGSVNLLLTDNGQLVQISSPQASKEAGVSRLCGSLGIPLDEVMAFGDDYNDLGLFRICGWPVAMGNAIPELKEIAAEITCTHDEDGVALVLETLLQ
jgi:predicted HD superfamily hydrolase involved in NAD metabolism